MRFRWLTAFPLLYAAAFIAIAASLTGQEGLGSFVRGQLLLVRVLAIAGCLAAVSVFRRGDYLRRAWMSLVLATVLVLVRDLLRLPPFDFPGSGLDGAGLIIAGLGVLSNVALLTGVWLLARSWKIAAISLPGGSSGAVATTLVAAGLALGVAGPSAWKHGLELLGGDLNALIMTVSAVVDILSLCLLAPLFLTAVALRGGMFAWPWALMTASMLSWLFYDGAAALGPSLGLGDFPLTDLFRGLAENFLFAAGFAQRLAVQKVHRLAAGSESAPAAQESA